MELLPRSVPGKTLYYRVNNAAARERAAVVAMLRATRPDALGIPMGAFRTIASFCAPEGVEPWVYITLDQSRPEVLASNARLAAGMCPRVIVNPEGGHNSVTMRTVVRPVVDALLAAGCTVVVSTNSGQVAGMVEAFADELEHRRLFLRLQAYDHNRGDDFTWATNQLARITALAGGKGAMGLDVGALEGPSDARFAEYFTRLPRGVRGGFGVWYDSLSPSDKRVLASWSPSPAQGFALVSTLLLIFGVLAALLVLWGVR